MAWLADRHPHRHRGDARRAAGARRPARRRRRPGCSAARRAARLDHPGLARVLDCGVHEHWPYVAVDRRAGVTLDEWLAQHPKPTTDEAALRGWRSVLRGLAFAHDAGVAHLDLQFHNLLVNERGQVARHGARASRTRARPMPAHGREHDRGGAARPRRRCARSAAPPSATCSPAASCCTACSPASRRSTVADIGQVIERMAPRGREFVRLPWTTPHPIPEPLRAIVNRSTAGAGPPALPQRAHLPRRAQRLARGAVRRRRRAGRAAARSPAHASATCRRCPGSAPRVQRVTGDREPAHRRDRAPPPARPGAVVRAAAHAQQLGAGPGHADPRQRPGADPAPRRRADRRRRRARGGEQPARLAGPLDDDGAKALRADDRPGRALPATPRRRCGRPATTARPSTSSPRCRTSAG